LSKNLGFIGCGNMGKAMIGGIVNSKLYDPNNVMVSDPSDSSLKEVQEKYRIRTTTDNLQVVNFADIIILSVKPNIIMSVIEKIKDFIKPSTVIISIAAGQKLEKLSVGFKNEVKLVRVMPNTPALVNEGMSAISINENVCDEELEEVVKIFNSFGKAEVIDEKLMDAVTAVSGSSPAYVYMFIEAMADGAVLQGMPRDKAYKFAAQAVLGSAKMVLETGKHPGKLKDEVSSPGGTTIEAVYSLEKNNFRGTVIEAINVCTDKSKNM
jgi:pyrroline-5-carboxylate reductase